MNRRKECVGRTRFLDNDSSRQTRSARQNMVTPAPTPRHARTHVPTRGRAPTHAWTPKDDHDRLMLGFMKGLLFQLFILKKTF